MSTPKTGNTWMRHLLAGIYRLPQYYVPPPLDCAKLSAAGDRWVTHYHTGPKPELLAWIRENGGTAITTIRHPGDVLVSLYHHVRGFDEKKIDPDFVRRMLGGEFERTNMTTDYAGPFSADLACSIEWMRRAGTHVVRYEDLRRDPAGTLRELTSRIRPVEDDRIDAAIEMCDIEQMRGMAGKFSGFFRGGRVGAWRDLLHRDGRVRGTPSCRYGVSRTERRWRPSWCNVFSGQTGRAGRGGKSNSTAPGRARFTNG